MCLPQTTHCIAFNLFWSLDWRLKSPKWMAMKKLTIEWTEVWSQTITGITTTIGGKYLRLTYPTRSRLWREKRRRSTERPTFSRRDSGGLWKTVFAFRAGRLHLSDPSPQLISFYWSHGYIYIYSLQSFIIPSFSGPQHSSRLITKNFTFSQLILKSGHKFQ